MTTTQHAFPESHAVPTRRLAAYRRATKRSARCSTEQGFACMLCHCAHVTGVCRPQVKGLAREIAGADLIEITATC